MTVVSDDGDGVAGRTDAQKHAFYKTKFYNSEIFETQTQKECPE